MGLLVKKIPMNLVNTEVEQWCNNHDLQLLAMPIIYRNGRFIYKGLSGEFAGYKGTRACQRLVTNPTFNIGSLLPDEQVRFVKTKFKEAGYTVTSCATPVTSAPIKVTRDCDGLVWETSWHGFYTAKHCPRELNKGSLGEQLVGCVLSYNNVDYKKEHTPIESNRKLRFDFFLPEYNSYIEYHGIQHFSSKAFSFEKSVDDFHARVKNDQTKREFAMEQGYYCMIPYTVNTFESITATLSDFLNVPLVVPTKQFIEVYNNDTLTRDTQVVDYYMKHSLTETSDKFNVSANTIERAVQTRYGKSKVAISQTAIKAKYPQIAEYYLQHNMNQTREKFGVYSTYVREAFRQIYGMSKKEYQVRQQEDRNKKIVDYYATHTTVETITKFNISASGLFLILQATRANPTEQ